MDRVLLRPPRTDPGPNSTTLPREVVLVWDQLSVAPEEKKNAKRILKEASVFCQETLGKGSVRGEASPLGRNSWPFFVNMHS